MVVQINIRFSEDFLKNAKKYAKEHGYLNIQELIREITREKVYEEENIRNEYMKKLKSKEATTFLSEEESAKFHKEMEKKARLK